MDLGVWATGVFGSVLVDALAIFNKVLDAVGLRGLYIGMVGVAISVRLLLVPLIGQALRGSDSVKPSVPPSSSNSHRGGVVEKRGWSGTRGG